MNQIGFQNFRKFVDFKPIEYSGLTYLVGRNNSGKSTIVKALLLIDNYLKSGDIFNFTFGDKVIEDANIVTFGRAKNKISKVNSIKFYQIIDKFSIEILISGEDDSTIAHVNYLTIRDLELGLTINLKPKEKYISILRHNQNNNNSNLNELQNEEYYKSQISNIDYEISKFKYKPSSTEYLNLVDKKNTWIEKINKLNSTKEKSNKSSNQIFISSEQNNSLYLAEGSYETFIDFNHVVERVVKQYELLHDNEFANIQKGEIQSDHFEDYRGIKEDAALILNSIEHFSTIISQSNLVYIAAQPTKQSALFLIRDKNNPLAQAIHEYFQLRIHKGQKAQIFIEKWIRLFEIGESFEIKLYGGEAYEIIIAKGKENIHLADKGMGSLQAMTILLRIANQIHINNNIKWISPYELFSDYYFTTIIIEEPELSLHPALQSQLADLFYEVYSKYRINMIIETHSEYLIRKTQIIVKENELQIAPNINPFAILYFDQDKTQRNIGYREDGKFIGEFGKGFYDESSNLALNLL